MPNWCTNKLIVRGTADDLRKFVEKANETTHLDWKPMKYDKQQGPNHVGPLNFAAFIPLPEDAARYTYGEREAYGYHWCANNWGTKWHVAGKRNFDRLENEEENIQAGKVLYEFNTAWSPPSKVFEAMVEQFPALDFLMKFREEDSYYGYMEGHNGEVTADETLQRPPWPELDEDSDEMPDDPTDEWWFDEGATAMEDCT